MPGTRVTRIAPRMSVPIDFERVFNDAPNPYMLLDHGLRYVAANNAYLDVTASTREQLLGHHILERFPNDPGDPANVPMRMLRDSLERVLKTGRRDHLAFIPYRVPMKVDGRIVEVDRFWSATHTPIFDGAGKVAFILQHTVDVTPFKDRPARTGAEGDALRAEAGVFARAQAVQSENERISAEREQLRQLFAQAPGFMCFLEGPDHIFELANPAYMTLVGARDILGKPLREALPEVVSQGFVTLLDRVYSTGEPFRGDAVRVSLQRDAGAAREERCVDFIYQPVRGRDGRTRGIFVQGSDVTTRVRAEQEREAAHRAAEAFSLELREQSAEVTAALEKARKRIAELEAQLAGR